MRHTYAKAVRRGYLSSHESTVDVAHSPEVVSENDRATNAKARRSERRPVFGIVMNSSEDRECPADIESFEGMFKFTHRLVSGYVSTDRTFFLPAGYVVLTMQAVPLVLTVLV